MPTPTRPANRTHTLGPPTDEVDRGGYLQVADWATYSNGAAEWFETDGVHLTARGVDAVTTFIAGTVQRVLPART